MKKARKQYSKEQKLKLIKLSYDEGQSISNIALRFIVSTNTIYNWLNQFKKHQEDAFPGNGIKIMSKSKREIEKLKKQIHEAQLERDIIKKQSTFFSRKA